MATRIAACFVLVLTPIVVSQERPKAPTSQDRVSLRPSDPALSKQAVRQIRFLELDDKRASAAEALWAMGETAVPALVQALDDPRPLVIQRVAQILRAIGARSEAAEARLEELAKSENPLIVAAAHHALVGVREKKVTLVAAFSDASVFELDLLGKKTRTIGGLQGPWYAERLGNGHTLICDCKGGAILEKTREGDVVWLLERFARPLRARRLVSGNTLVVGDRGGLSVNYVVEFDADQQIVWEYGGPKINVTDAIRLLNGNTLVAEDRSDRILEIDRTGEIVWEFAYDGQTVYGIERLSNGNTLICLRAEGKIVEVDREGDIVNELLIDGRPSATLRLPNGHTLVAHDSGVSEYTPEGKRVWNTAMSYAGSVGRY